MVKQKNKTVVPARPTAAEAFAAGVSTMRNLTEKQLDYLAQDWVEQNTPQSQFDNETQDDFDAYMNSMYAAFGEGIRSIDKSITARRAAHELSVATDALNGAKAVLDVLQHFASCGKLNEIDVYSLCKIGSEQAASCSDRASDESDFFDEQALHEKTEVRHV